MNNNEEQVSLIYEINRFLKESQCYIVNNKGWTFTLYDEYNEFKVKDYNTIDFNVIVKDTQKHINKGIDKKLINNTKVKLKEYYKKYYNVNLEFVDKWINISYENWKTDFIKYKKFKSYNIKYLKLMIAEELWIQIKKK